MIFVISITIVCALLLILVVLAQNSKGGGLTEQFGGSSSSQLIGVKRTGDLLEKVTWGLAITIFILSVTSKALITPAEQITDAEEDKVEIINQPAASPQPQQTQPAAPPAGDENSGLPEELTGGEGDEPSE